MDIFHILFPQQTCNANLKTIYENNKLRTTLMFIGVKPTYQVNVDHRQQSQKKHTSLADSQDCLPQNNIPFLC